MNKYEETVVGVLKMLDDAVSHYTLGLALAHGDEGLDYLKDRAALSDTVRKRLRATLENLEHVVHHVLKDSDRVSSAETRLSVALEKMHNAFCEELAAHRDPTLGVHQLRVAEKQVKLAEEEVIEALKA